MNLVTNTQELDSVLAGSEPEVTFPGNGNVLLFDEQPCSGVVSELEAVGAAAGRSVHLR